MRVPPHELKRIAQEIQGSSGYSQRRRVEAALELGGITTVDGIRFLDIIRPATIIQNLRDDGQNIVTQRTWDVTEAGERHYVGLYVALPETQGGEI